MKLYLAGPMRGIAEFNFPAFHAAAKVLRGVGHEVFSPAEKDIERWGHVPANPAGDEHALEKHLGMKPGEAIRVCLGDDLAWICQHAEGIALLPGWQASKGARAERATAEALGLKMLYLDQAVVDIGLEAAA